MPLSLLALMLAVEPPRAPCPFSFPHFLKTLLRSSGVLCWVCSRPARAEYEHKRDTKQAVLLHLNILVSCSRVCFPALKLAVLAD